MKTQTNTPDGLRPAATIFKPQKESDAITGVLINSLLLTLELMSLAALGSLAVALIVVNSLRQLSVMGQRVCLVVMVMATALPLYVHASGWEATWGKFGWLPMIQSGTRSWSTSGFFATVWIHIIAGSSGASLLLWAGWQWLSAGWTQAASLDRSPWQVFWSVELPLLKPVLWVSASWSALLVATDLTVADLYSLRTLPDVAYQQFALREGWYAGMASTGLALILALVALLVLRRLPRRDAFGSSVFRIQPTTTKPPLRRAIGVGGSTIGMLLMLVIPVIGLVTKAGWTAKLTDAGVEPSFSVGTFAETLLDAAPRFADELKWSGLLAAVVAGMAVVVGWGVYLLMQRSRRYWIGSCVVLTVALIPGPMLALVVVWLFSQPWLPGGELLYSETLIPTALASLPKPLAVMVAVLFASRASFSSGIFAAASMDGASRWVRWSWVEGRLMLAATLVGALFSALLAIGDLSANLLVSPPAVQTVAVRLFGLLHSGIRRQEAGLCLITILFEAIFVAIVGWIAMRSRSSRHADSSVG